MVVWLIGHDPLSDLLTLVDVLRCSPVTVNTEGLNRDLSYLSTKLALLT